jgi:hypothetical protein
MKENIQQNTADKYVYLLTKNCNLPSLGLHTGRPEIYLLFSIFVGHVYPPGSKSRDPNESGSNPDPHHTGIMY